MKAIVYTQYGPPDVLQFKEVAIPTPADNEVLVKICAASVNPLDSGVMRGTGRLTGTGLLKPRQRALGSDFAGRVEAIGRHVKQYQAGDEVFGGNIWGGGGFAEYVCGVEDRLARKPANISFEQAAAVPVAAITALQGLRNKGRIQRGQKVLVDGASGVWVHLRSRLPNRSGLKSLPCAARGMSTPRDPLAQTISLITRWKLRLVRR
jgi:NADPH:quinone reductase-like Zn-dependent oxidoreductase